MSVNPLLSTLRLGGSEVANRFVAQPVQSNLAENHQITPPLLDRYKTLAASGWGMIITEPLAVEKTAAAYAKQLVGSAEFFFGLKQFFTVIRQASPDVRLVVQLMHAGRLAAGEHAVPLRVYADDEADDIIDDSDIRRISGAFAESAKLLQEAGADGIELPLSNGYLIGDFLRPRNRRAGMYGGGFENRVRFFIETVRKIRQVTSPSFLIGAKLSAYEGVRGGIGTGGVDDILEDLDEVVKIAQITKREGLTYINVSQGTLEVTPGIATPSLQEALLSNNVFRYTKLLKKSGVITVGAGYSILGDNLFAFAAENIEKDYTDMIGLGRQSLCDPATPLKMSQGALETVRHCQVCDQCSQRLHGGHPVGCVYYDPAYHDSL